MAFTFLLETTYQLAIMANGNLTRLSKSWASLPDGSEGFYNSLPRVFKEECLVRSKEENPEKQKERQQTVKGKSVAELSAITSLSEFPVPKPSIFDSAKRNKSKERSR